jgi:heme exporter protein B
MENVGIFSAAARLVERDLKVIFRHVSEALNPLVFFVVVATLFPLATSPDAALLRDMAPGVVWVAALLSSTLALDSLFKADMDDGTMEQLALSPQPLAWLLLAKIVTHWVVSGLPLVLIAPLVARGFFLPTEAILPMMLALALGTPTLSLIGAVGAALTAGVRRGGALLSLLVLPLSLPTMIFGARATDLAGLGEDPSGPLYLLAALLFLTLSLAPLAAAAAIRISLD